MTRDEIQAVESDAVSHMKKIRINELARELEVKPGKILELLPEYGVSEKKTHSSSIDEDVAIKIKTRLHDDHVPGRSYDADSESDEGSAVAVLNEPAEHEETSPEASRPSPEITRPRSDEKAAAAAAHQDTAEEPATDESAENSGNGRLAAKPLRPPLAGMVGHRESPPLRPPTPPVIPTPPRQAIRVPQPPAPPVQTPPVQTQPLQSQHGTPTPPAMPAPPVTAHAPGAPAPHSPTPPPTAPAPPTSALTTTAPQQTATQPGVPLMPRTPLAPQARRPVPTIPAKPVPTLSPRPGQILSGPRQPLPEGTGEGLRQPTVAPGFPRQAPSMPAPPRTPAPPRQGPPISQTTPSTGQQQNAQGTAPRPPLRPSLAGQPAARPIVPPRPDLVARLTKPPMAPPAPAAPRPGMPNRPQASPTPGQPIYRGPIRPGQPMMRGPGGPGSPSGPSYTPSGPGGPQNRGPRRLLHPTSPMRIEPASPVPADTQRRHQTKPGGVRPGEHRRETEREGKMYRQVSRRDQPAPPPVIDREITIADGITVKELSEKLGVKANHVIKKLVERKIFATINQTLDTKLAEELSRDFGASTNKVSFEEESTQEIVLAEDDKDLVKRGPVVTIMGHVDHGKTSLLDAIRVANVAGREAGGITQHIGAYRVEKNGQFIVFIDTPGHEAFTRMRARGAKVTDIVVLVVSADDGVMPQTLEAIDHAKAAGVPIIVAINKIDKPDAQPERIKQQLADRGLLAEDWGGDVVMVPVSAKAKTNLDLLLEMILLVADVQDLKASPGRPGVGWVLESQLDKGRGPVPTVLVRNGTLRVGDYFICGSVFGKVRAMFDDRGAPVREAGPSVPVEVLGLDSMPDVGDSFQVVTDTAKAKQIVIYRESKARDIAMQKGKLTLDQLHDRLREGETKELNIVLKADVGGTAEVISDSLQALSNDEVKVRVLRSGVGAITESDVLLASTSSAIIIGFNVKPERNAAAVADKEKVEIRLHSIIYNLTDEVKKAMTGMLDPVFKEVYQGRISVREVFRITKVGVVAGCMVTDGFIKRDSLVRVTREGVVVHTGRVDTLKRFKNDVSEVKTGFECGIALSNFQELKAGDTMEAFMSERVPTEL